jgi:filamentous hemagglutinin family protein
MAALLAGPALALTSLGGPASGQIKPDGATATGITSDASGRVTVGIARASVSGVSHNTYSAFSVARPGVGLDNRGIDAKTIVNEVTSNARSVLRGPVEVLGSRAHVVIANPNGITVDGTRFINTGGVALTGGKVRYDAGNTVLVPGKGSIAIEGRGLSGAMTTLQLVAGRIKVDGPIRNSGVSPGSDVALIGPGSEVVLDSAVSPLSSLRPLASRRSVATRVHDGMVVDVTPRGSLSASRVSVTVDARGAGVSFAGRGQAALGDFTLTANGKIRTLGAVIAAERNVAVAGRSVDVKNSNDRAGTMTALTKGVTLTTTAGDLDVEGQVTGAERAEEDAASKGGVTLSSARGIRLYSENGKRLAIAFASKDDLVVEARGDLVNETGRLLSNANTVLKVAGTIRNVTDRTQAFASSASPLRVETVSRRRPGLFGWLGLRRRITVIGLDAGSNRIPEQKATIAGATIDIVSGRLENSGEIDALDGALSILTKTFVNRGARDGGFKIVKRCGWTCATRADGGVTLASARINAAGSAAIVARDEIVNDGGDIVAYGNLAVTAPRVTARAVEVAGVAKRPASLGNVFSGPSATLTLTPSGGTFQAPVGTVTLSTKAPVVLEGGVVEGAVGTVVPAGTAMRSPAVPRFIGAMRHAGLLRFWLE